MRAAAFTPEKVQALLDLLRNSSFGKVALLCDGDQPAGYVVVTYGYSIEFHGRDLLIDDLYRRQEYRGRGWESEAANLFLLAKEGQNKSVLGGPAVGSRVPRLARAQG